jgi:hypothetical protein
MILKFLFLTLMIKNKKLGYVHMMCATIYKYIEEVARL